MRIAFLPIACLAAASVFAASCIKSEKEEIAAAPYNTEMDVQELMVHVMTPGAQGFWKSWGTIYDQEGEHDLAPETEADWKRVEDGAATVIMTTNMLMLPAYARKPAEEWNKHAKAVADVAVEGKAAAERMATDEMYELGDRLDKACDGCHIAFAATGKKMER